MFNIPADGRRSRGNRDLNEALVCLSFAKRKVWSRRRRRSLRLLDGFIYKGDRRRRKEKKKKKLAKYK